jgi:hypothetical protein
VSSTGRAIPAVTLAALNPVPFAKIAYNSFPSKILPVTPTRSRFCGGKFFPALCFQDFAHHGGRGDTPVVSGQWSVVSDLTRELLLSAVVAEHGSIVRPTAKGQEPRAGSR